MENNRSSKLEALERLVIFMIFIFCLMFALLFSTTERQNDQINRQRQQIDALQTQIDLLRIKEGKQ